MKADKNEDFEEDISSIRKAKCRPATPTTTTPTPSRSGYPSWIQKRAGLESSGRIVSSLYWITKRIAFFSFFTIFYCPKGKKSPGRSPPHELKVGPRSGSFLLVDINIHIFCLHTQVGNLRKRLFLLLPEAQSSGFFPVS